MTTQQQQVKKQSGSQYHLNLDLLTYAALSACQQTYRNHGQNFSNSVIVRRALRTHLAMIEQLTSRSVEQEIVHTMRAAKGLL